MGLSVLHPGLLIAGLFCISIPILVHLLRRKHRPISWGAMRFLEQAYKKRRRLITIEQLILLLLRCAIVALIAGGVGMLVLGSGSAGQRAKTLVIVLDNSIHSAAAWESGEPSIQYQKQRALELLGTLDASRGDRAALITAAAPAMAVATPATSDLLFIRSKIEGVRSTDADRDMNGVLGHVSDMTEGLEDGSTLQPALFMGDGGWDRDTQRDQHQLPGVESVLLDSPPGTVDTNIAIIDAQPLRPMVTRKNRDSASGNEFVQSQDEIQGVRVVLHRSDASDARTTQLLIENAQTNTQLAALGVEWAAGQGTLTRSIPLDPESLDAIRGGSAILRVSLADSDPNPRDNTRLVGLPIRQHIGVGIIDSYTQRSDSAIRPSRWVRAVLAADDGLMSVQQINASSASDRIDPTLDVLFILSPSTLDNRSWDRIARLNAGGMPIIITPDSELDHMDWVSNLSTLAPGLISGTIQTRSFDPPIGLAGELDTEAKFLSGIADEYPDLASSVTLTRRLSLEPGPNALTLLRDSQQQPLVIASARNDSQSDINHAAGRVVLWGAAFDARWTDLPARPLFVAMTHELLRSLLAQSVSPMNRIAGQSASALEFESLEPLIGQSTTPTIAGAFVQVNAQGTAQRAVIVNPDASLSAADHSILESPEAAIARGLPNIDIQDVSPITELSESSLEQASTPGRSLSLMLFAIASVLGILELMLARQCSYKATTPHPQALQPRGSA